MENNADLSTETLNELIKASAVYLANLVIENVHKLQDVAPTDITRLYRIGIRHSRSRAVSIAAKRLLAALITISPPGGSGIITVELPGPITTTALYRVITSPRPSVDELYVEVGALKTLTRNGQEVDATEGIVGWLIRALGGMTEAYADWCANPDDSRLGTKEIPFGPIRPANPAETASVIIDLVAAIISSHACLFSYEDLRRVCEPIFSIFWRGASAELPNVRHKWSRPMVSFAIFFDTLARNVAIPTDVFRKAVAVACLAQGQGAPESEHAGELVSLALGPEAGRRGETAVRLLLEGSARSSLDISALDIPALDHYATRGAVL
jgi:hypothetical protein